MASIIGGPVVPPFSIQDISSSLRLCKFAYTRHDGRIDEGRLTNSPFPRAVRLRGCEQASAAIVSMGRRRGGKEECQGSYGDDSDGVDINTFEGTKRIIRE